MNSNLSELPPNLPRPKDDGGARHLTSLRFPEIELRSTNGKLFSTGEFKHGHHILFCYPMTGKPGMELPVGWDRGWGDYQGFLSSLSSRQASGRGPAVGRGICGSTLNPECATIKSPTS